MNEWSIYEDLLRLPGIKVTKVEAFDRSIEIEAEVDEGDQICPNCAEPTAIVRSYTERAIRDLDISGRQVWLHLKVKQYECVSCKRYFTQRISWATKGKSYTKRQAKFIFEMCEQQSYSQAAVLLDMNAKSVERVYLEYASQVCQRRKRLSQVRRLGIDELSHRKGRKSYYCVLTDLDRGVHIDLLPDRRKETLSAYFQELGPEWCAQIEAVSCDMWSPYIEVAETFFPEAIISIDRFHVVVLLNQVLDRFRKKLRREYPKENLYKRTKWQLFKRLDKLSDRELGVLSIALASNEQLAEIYQLRNDFHAVFDFEQEPHAADYELNAWMEKLEQSTTATHWEPFLKTLANWKGYILNFVQNRLTNAATEGLNNIIRHIKRISFGIHNFEHLRIRLLAKVQ